MESLGLMAKITIPPPPTEDSAPENIYRAARIQYWNDFYRELPRWAHGRHFYQSRLIDIYRFLIPPHSRVLEVGCGSGDLLASLNPAVGVGCDISSTALEFARERHGHLRFILGDILCAGLNETFDYVVVSDLVNELWDVQDALTQLTSLSHSGTRIIFNFYSRFWETPRRIAEFLKLARPQLTQNWLTPQDLHNLLYVCGFEVIRSWQEILCPINVPIIANALNRYAVHIWPFNILGITNMMVARPIPTPRPETRVT